MLFTRIRVSVPDKLLIKTLGLRDPVAHSALGCVSDNQSKKGVPISKSSTRQNLSQQSCHFGSNQTMLNMALVASEFVRARKQKPWDQFWRTDPGNTDSLQSAMLA